MRNNVRREDPTVQHLLLGQMRSHTKHTRRLCKTKKLVISFCLRIKCFFYKGYTLTEPFFIWRVNTAQVQQGLTFFVIRGGGEGLTTSFLFSFYGKCCADPLYLINWVVIFSLTRKQTEICSKQSQTSSVRALTMQRANCLPKLLSWRRSLQSWFRLSGIRKYSCHNLFMKCLLFMTNFAPEFCSFKWSICLE